MTELKEKVLKQFESKNKEFAQERFDHSLRVAKKCVELAPLLGVDPVKAEITGIVHDYAKFYSMDDFFELVKEYNLDTQILDNSFKILHALLAPYAIQKDLGITDKEILEACEVHTTGKPRMTPLQELLFLADFLEEGREGVEEIRNIAQEDYKRAIALILDAKISKNIVRKGELNANTLLAFQRYQVYLDGKTDKVKAILRAIDHNLVKDVKVYDLRNTTPLYDYVVIATALSPRQMEAAANYIKTGFDLRGIEMGEQWTLADAKDVIVHLFTEEEREKYSLDKLYKDLPQLHL